MNSRTPRVTRRGGPTRAQGVRPNRPGVVLRARSGHSATQHVPGAARAGDDAFGVPAWLIDATAGAAAAVLALSRPADRVLSAFFREHRALGQHDRGFVAETVYAILRRKRLLEHMIEAPDARRFVLGALVLLRGVSIRELDRSLRSEEREWLSRLKRVDRSDLPLGVRCDFPDWAIERLWPRFGEVGVLALCEALNRPAPLDLRANLLKVDRDDLIAALAKTGVEAEPTPYAPSGIRLAGKPALARHPLFLEGAFEVQDEGSQLLGYLVGPRRREMVVDFCAGAGGKSLALGALMRSTGRVYAIDVSDRRLAELKPRLARSGLSNIHPQRIENERDPRVKRLAGKIDRVLVDAPCSGLGTVRRNPDLKWRQTPADVVRMAREQSSILASAAYLPKPGGRLVYATCSLLPEENEDVVRAFLDAHPAFRLLDAGEVLHDARIELPNATDGERFLRLLPHVHGTDGFFAAVMERSGDTARL